MVLECLGHQRGLQQVHDGQVGTFAVFSVYIPLEPPPLPTAVAATAAAKAEAATSAAAAGAEPRPVRHSSDQYKL